MILSTENILFIGSIIFFVAIVAGKVSNRFGTPMLLLFLLVGMLFGTDGLGIEFDNFASAQFIGMIALSVILFSGGMDTDFKEIKPVMKEGLVLSTVGVLLTAAFTGLFIYFVGGALGKHVALPVALLTAAVMSSTDSASVFAILRAKKQGLKHNLRPLLELESGSNDPMAYILTILLIQIVSGSGAEASAGQVALTFLKQMGIGALAGWLLGLGAIEVINRLNIGNKSLYSILLLSVIFFISSFTNMIEGNGFLAVYIAGIVMGNQRLSYKHSLRTFFDGITWLVQIVMFLMLGLLVNPHELVDIALLGVLVGVFMIVIARPLAVHLSLLPLGSKLPRNARHYISWVGLRGAAPILFATYPKLAGLDPNNTIFNLVFFITIFSLVVQGTTVSSMANVMGVSDKSPQEGFDIDLPDEVRAALTEVEITSNASVGKTLKEITLPPKTLVMMIRRDGHYIIPNGQTEIHKGDRLLLISEEEAHDPQRPIKHRGHIARFESVKSFIESVSHKGHLHKDEHSAEESKSEE